MLLAIDLDRPTLRQRAEIIGAIIVRDLMVRFGRNSLGFVWVILEPMILTAGVMVVWNLIGNGEHQGISITAFVMSGYMPLTLWRHLNNPMPRLLTNNRSLLVHRVISHMDLVFARIISEFLSTSIAFCVVYFIVLAVGLVGPIYDWTLVLCGWIYMGWFYAGIGCFIVAATELWEPGEKFIGPAQYLALPVSGTFFLVDWMPGYAQNLLYYNPSVHCFEMFRAGFFGPMITTHYDFFYITACSIISTFIGISALFYVRDHMRDG